MNENPYAASASPRDDPQRWSLDSPLLRDGWAHWAGRLISISLGVGLISAVWAFLTTNLDAQAPRPWPLWYLVPGAIVSSLPAWALGLSFRGFRSATPGRQYTAKGFMAVVYASFLLGGLVGWSLYEWEFFAGGNPWANAVANAMRTPAQVIMLAFVALTWGGPVPWWRLIVLSGGAIFVSSALQQLIEPWIHLLVQPAPATFILCLAFESSAFWTFSFGMMLPFAIATGRVDE